MVGPFLPDAEKLAAVRSSLPALEAGIYLNTGAVGPLPTEVAAAMAELETYELRTGRAHDDYFEETLERMAEARAAVAAVLTTDVDAIALTHSTTDGMNLAALAVEWRPGDRALTTGHEHAGALGPLYALRARGVELDFVDIGDGGDDERTLAAIDEGIRPGTRLVVVSHVLWTTGALMPVRRIVERAHRDGAIVAVDGAQSVGAIAVDVEALGADFYAVAAQKWLLGPEGMGALFVSAGARERASLPVGGWFSYASMDGTGGAVPFGDARRYMASGYHRPSIVGMARSIGWLSMYVGLDWVHRRGTAAAARAAGVLGAIPGISVITPVQSMATLVTFRIAGWPAQAALDELSSRVFAIARTIPNLDAIRISVGCWTSDDEVDRFAAAVAFLAAHTPATLPPRRTLSILNQA